MLPSPGWRVGCPETFAQLDELRHPGRERGTVMKSSMRWPLVCCGDHQYFLSRLAPFGWRTTGEHGRRRSPLATLPRAFSTVADYRKTNQPHHRDGHDQVATAALTRWLDGEH